MRIKGIFPLILILISITSVWADSVRMDDPDIALADYPAQVQGKIIYTRCVGNTYQIMRLDFDKRSVECVTSVIRYDRLESASVTPDGRYLLMYYEPTVPIVYKSHIFLVDLEKKTTRTFMIKNTVTTTPILMQDKIIYACYDDESEKSFAGPTDRFIMRSHLYAMDMNNKIEKLNINLPEKGRHSSCGNLCYEETKPGILCFMYRNYTEDDGYYLYDMLTKKLTRTQLPLGDRDKHGRYICSFVTGEDNRLYAVSPSKNPKSYFDPYHPKKYDGKIECLYDYSYGVNRFRLVFAYFFDYGLSPCRNFDLILRKTGDREDHKFYAFDIDRKKLIHLYTIKNFKKYNYLAHKFVGWIK